MDALREYLVSMFHLALAGELQGVWFWAAVYAALAGSYSLWFQLRTRRWSSTNGRLEALGIRKFGLTEPVRAEQDYVGDALYSYRVDGESYRGTRISPWVVVASHNARALLSWQQRGVQRDANGGVRVFHDPARPEKSLLVVAGWPGITVTLLLVLLPALAYYARFHS